jgi:hypothetical protein
MVSCIYRFIFSDNIDDLNNRYDMLSDYEQERISELDAISYFDYVENEKYFFYVITSPNEIKKYIQILENNLIQFDITDLTKDVLSNRVDLSKQLITKIDKDNTIKWDFFIEDVKEWMLENLDIDLVLDRISEVGIQNITDIEKLFLENYKQ